MQADWTDKEMELVRRMAGSDILSIRQFGAADLGTLLDIVGRFENDVGTPLSGKVLAALFFEPSTRTRLSFESAMQRLGGGCLGFASPASSSATKGESLADTIRMAEQYCDLIVIRHPLEGAARLAAEATDLPVINGGDGANQHPTQTLLDLYTIRRHCGRLDGLKVGFLGDLKYGRAAHGLIEALALFENEFALISPLSLRLSRSRIDELDESGTPYAETDDLANTIGTLDVLYATRIQRERFGDPLHYERVRNAYQIDSEMLSRARGNMVLMHPLPRVNEIHREVDDSSQSKYFEQARNGVTVRKALLAMLLGAIE